MTKKTNTAAVQRPAKAKPSPVAHRKALARR